MSCWLFPTTRRRELSDWGSSQLWAAAATGFVVASCWAVFQLAHPVHWRQYVIAFLLGAAVAVAELVSRYTDSPTAAIMSIPASLYVGVNASASASALFLIRVFKQDFGQSGAGVAIVQILVAGMASAAFFRSSLFTVPAGGQILGIGPSAVLDVIMRAADRAVDRQRALIRARQAAVLMRDLSFDRCTQELVPFVLGTMQNLTSSERDALLKEVDLLRGRIDEATSDQAAARELALILLRVVGSRVLSEAVDRLPPEGRALRREEGEAGSPVVDLRDHSGVELIVDFLEANGDQADLSSVQAQLGLTLARFSELVDAMVADGCLEMSGVPGEEVIRLIASDTAGGRV